MSHHRIKHTLDIDIMPITHIPSQQAVVIQSIIIHALKSTAIDTTGIARNMVYNHPSISLLAEYIHLHSQGRLYSVPDTLEQRVEEMKAFLTHLTEDIPESFVSPVPTINLAAKLETVLVTGTTGSLGAHLLAGLVDLDSVVRIYAINRAGQEMTAGEWEDDIRSRQAIILERHGFAASVARSPKIVYLQGDTASPGFLLNEDVRKEILSSLTCFIHNGSYSKPVYS